MLICDVSGLVASLDPVLVVTESPSERRFHTQYPEEVARDVQAPFHPRQSIGVGTEPEKGVRSGYNTIE